ncbi:MAG: T9SS type A sorting domain-containing protein [Bacteroidetes bacterium]|nr:T9SS type A sorting domain-containing protein [Bacteroidota bacterium]
MKNIFFTTFLFIFSCFTAIQTQAQCSIYDLVATPGDCMNGEYYVTINFQFSGNGNEGFHIQGNGNNYGNFAYTALPVTLGPFPGNGINVFEFVAVDNQHPDCHDFDTVGPISCAGGACAVTDFAATPGDCNPDGTYPLTLNFNYANPVNGNFHVIYEGQNLGNFALANLPITLPHFQDNGEPSQVIKVCLNDAPDCCAIDEFSSPNCVPVSACDINDLSVIPGDCNNDGNYPITINFNYVNPGNDYFNVIFEGQTIGTYLLSNLPVTIPNFNDNGLGTPTIHVCINDVPDCCAHKTITAPNCTPSNSCHIWDVFAEAHPCENGHFMLDVEFNHENTGSQGFKIKAGNQVFGPFDYGEPYYTIGPLSPGVVYEIVVRDVENETCKGVYVFGPVNCGGDCHIYDLTAEVSDCNGDGQFFVTIDFQHENSGGDGFKIYGNGNVYGYFNYNELPVTIGPLTSNNQQLEFGAADVNHPDCHAFMVVQVPDCDGNGGGDCHIFDLVADVHPCLPNGTFYVTLNLQHENTSGYFKLKGNGVTYGIFSYDDLPLEVGPLIGNGTTPYEFVAVDIHNENCKDDISIGTIECNGAGDCLVHDLIVDPSTCNPDDSYNLWVWFQVDYPGNNFYDVYHNGDFVGYFPLTHVPVTLPHLFANNEPMQTLTICINDNPDCCLSISYEAPNCDGLVYPGDSNRDNICNNFDVLNLGLAYGSEGPHRPVQGIEWVGLESENWTSLFSNGVNFKNADCSGDGIVNSVDIAAILLNYGDTHGEQQPVAFVEGNESDPPLYVDLPSANDLQPGMSFQAPIMLGTVDASLDNVYGIAFTMKFDPEIIKPSSIDLQYDPSWLGVQGINLLSFDRTLADEGEVKVALVRTDQNNVSGYGQIAGIIGVIDNIAGKESVAIEIKDVKAIRENEELISLRKPIEVVDLLVEGSHEQVEPGLAVYPNPAKDVVYFTLPNNANPDFVEVKSVDGKRMLFEKSSNNKLNISNLGDGVYILRVKSGDRIYQQKIVK